ncbi:TVP38/TMEM64 family protein [Ammoniphilus resinae]|uniref:TVP38/TMEM64 family membrane protein n=1 Tax=Ammoniphilus resinae TaxID=861532 RepID=A0ABS4GU46_9BACL|nr:TVP38/TMEM64 family protein [Ammoniphilus resinae]MBP1933784.1 putative membrane protein YdjX (TVP38/TMEM64 family) [Ammoniphilus resinae]
MKGEVFLDLFSSFSVEEVSAYLQSLGMWAALIGAGLIIFQTFFPIYPFIVVAAANVFVFGLWWGFLLNWLSAVTGAVFMFWAVRTIGADWAKKRLGRYKGSRALQAYLARKGFQTIFLLRLFPIIPPMVLNLLAGLSLVGTKAYISATLIGKLPAIWIQSWLGHDFFHLSEENMIRFVVVLVVFLLVLWVGMKIVKKKIKVS